MYYHFKIHNDPDGLWAECIELKGCATQADSIEELQENMKEALDLYLDELADSKMIFPLPDDTITLKDNVVKVKVDSQIAFSFYLRENRLRNNKTQKEMADMLGFKHLYSYQRLESSKKANPELKTLEKLKEVFPEFDLNMVI
jgi:antitoxin HicB